MQEERRGELLSVEQQVTIARLELDKLVSTTSGSDSLEDFIMLKGELERTMANIVSQKNRTIADLLQRIKQVRQMYKPIERNAESSIKNISKAIKAHYAS